jgi:hypothetical protein
MFRYGKNNVVTIYCPGCKMDHNFDKRWEISGTKEKPTVSPSILVRWNNADTNYVCHSFITDGKIKYLNDCTHDLKGKIIDMEN